jgi:hypothetical protein
MPWIGAVNQHFRIMICFKIQNITIFQILFYKVGDNTKVGGYSYFAAFVFQGQSCRIFGIMRNGKRTDQNLIDFKRTAALKKM